MLAKSMSRADRLLMFRWSILNKKLDLLMWLDIITHFCWSRVVGTEKILERLDSIIWDCRVEEILLCCLATAADKRLDTI